MDFCLRRRYRFACLQKRCCRSFSSTHSRPKLDSTYPRERAQCSLRRKRDVFCGSRGEESDAHSFQLLRTSQTAPTINLVLVAEGSHEPTLFQPRPERHFSNDAFCNTSGQVRKSPAFLRFRTDGATATGVSSP